MFRRITGFFQRSIQFQLLVPMLLLVLVPAAYVGYTLGLELFTTQVADLNELEELEVSLVVDESHLFLREVSDGLLSLSELSSVQDLAQAQQSLAFEITEESLAAFEQAKSDVTSDFVSFANAHQIFIQVRFIDTSGDEVVRIDYNTDTLRATISEGGNKSGRPYFDNSINLPQGEIFVSPVELNREGENNEIQVLGTRHEDIPIPNEQLLPVLRYARPVYAPNLETSRFESVGVVVLNLDMDAFFELLDVGHDELILINEDGYQLFNSLNPLETFAWEDDIADLNRPAGEDFKLINSIPELNVSELFDFSTQLINDGTIQIDDDSFLVHTIQIQPEGASYKWTLVAVGDQSVIINPLQERLIQLAIQLVAFVVVAAFLVVLVARSITSPLVALSNKAKAVAVGDYEAGFERVDAYRQDEIGDLDEAFSDMSRRTYDVLRDLEGLVAERTQELQTAVEVSNQVSTILDVDRLLQDVVDLTKERFGLYHAHIYILDDDQRTLYLTAGAGHVGRQMVAEKRHIDIENRQSIVATVARTRNDAIYNDVRKSPTFLAHPLLPDTRAELAVALVARGQVLGVLDIQADEINFFTEDRLVVLKVLASQIANTLSNARLFEVADRTSRHEQALSAIDHEIQNAVGVDEMLQTTVRELGKALRVAHTAIELDIHADLSTENGDSGEDK